MKKPLPQPRSSAPVQRVWDPLVRLFHWSLVVFFSVAWLTGDDYPSLHHWSGYLVAGLVLFRVMWGLVGSRHARFSDFIYHPRDVLGYLKSLHSGQVRHYRGHNPAGGAMVLALLLTLAALAFSGIWLLAGDGAGPLAHSALAPYAGKWLKEVHEALANVMIVLIVLHLAGVLVSSLRHRENLVKAMFTGQKGSPHGQDTPDDPSPR